MSDAFVKAAEDAFASGDAAAARQLLKQATDAGDLNGAYAYAVALAYGQGGTADTAAASEVLSSIADALPAARRFHRIAMASGWCTDLSHKDAVEDLLAGARSGNPSDQRETGLLLLLAGAPGLADTVLLQAADNGDPGAAMALLRHGKAPPAAPWSKRVRQWLLQTRHPLAKELTELRQSAIADLGGSNIDWNNVSKKLEHAAEPVLNTRELAAGISANTTRDIIPAAVCDYVLTTGLRALQPSTIVDPGTGEKKLDPHRQSLSMTYAPHMQDLVLHGLERKMALLADMPWENCEQLVLLFYRPGEQYKPHVDYFSPDDDGNAQELSRAGQRVATSLVCLHPADSGGGTLFPRFGAMWTGHQGDALSFRNVNVHGEPEPLSLHQGQLVETGWKALASLWIRERPMGLN